MAIDASKITVDIAEQIYKELRYSEDQGTTEIVGETVWWWADHSSVWFYGSPDASGNDTIKRFEVTHSFHVEESRG